MCRIKKYIYALATIIQVYNVNIIKGYIPIEKAHATSHHHKGTMINIDTLIHATGSIAQAFATIYDTKNVLLFCYTPWCNICKKIKPHIEELAKKYPHIYFVSINIELYEDFMQEYDIKVIPTLLFIKEEKLIGKETGYKNNSELENLLKKFSYTQHKTLSDE